MTDRRVVLLVVGFLGVFALVVALGAIYLTNAGHNVPEALWTLAGTAVGGLGAILAKTSTEPGPVAVVPAPAPVVPVVSPPVVVADPVPPA